METQVKNEKKAKARAQLKILKQFDSMAENFQKQNLEKQDTFTLKKETAGDIRRREKEAKKKEKTLGAKLRLKAKKTK